jgi:hypothetical protein
MSSVSFKASLTSLYPDSLQEPKRSRDVDDLPMPALKE